jgi:hypothetical protein
MINYVEILIGSRKVSHIERDLLEILDYFTTNASQSLAEYANVGRYDNMNIIQNPLLPNNGNGPLDLYVPLPFWFCKQLSAALPLIAIPNQIVQLRFNLNPFTQLVNYDGPEVRMDEVNPSDARLLVDYYHLSDDEKLDFLTNDRQYNYEQYQVQSFSINANTCNTNIQLSFVNSVKELVFVFREVESEDNNDFFNYGLRGQNRQGEAFFSTVQLYFNGIARTEKLDEKYFRTVTTLASHTNPGNRNIYVISFAIAPESNQSSGSANVSQLDNISLSFEFVNNLPACKLKVYAISYNVLDIQNRLASVIFL